MMLAHSRHVHRWLMVIAAYGSLVQFILMNLFLWKGEVFPHIEVAIVCLSIFSLVASGIALKIALRIYSDHFLLSGWIRFLAKGVASLALLSTFFCMAALYFHSVVGFVPFRTLLISISAPIYEAILAYMVWQNCNTVDELITARNQSLQYGDGLSADELANLNQVRAQIDLLVGNTDPIDPQMGRPHTD